MLSIRLSRTGKKNQPSYRLIVSEKTKDPWGDYLEILGAYNPRVSSEITNLKKERLEYWLSKGAKLSATVNNLLVNQGVIKAPKIKIVKIKKKAIAEEAKGAVTATQAGSEEEQKVVPATEAKLEDIKA